MNIFRYQNYKEFLRSMIDSNKDRYGYQSRLAEQAGCQKTYLSQVLNGNVHLTPDHAAGLCQFWGLNDEESSHFMDLVHQERASTKALREWLSKRLEQRAKASEDLAKHFEQPSLTSSDELSLYYSSWYWMAIHVATSIPNLSTPATISQRLNLPTQLVNVVLQGLLKMRLVAKENSKWKCVANSIHLPSSSYLTLLNHQNWRQMACQKTQIEKDLDSVEDGKERNTPLHYTAVHALSKKDIRHLREILLKAITKTRETVAPSPEEELVCVTVDLFTL